MISRPSWRGLTLLALILVLLALPVLGTDQYQLHMMIVVLNGTILAAGLRMVLLTGRLTLGHSAFMAIGAYASALLALKLGVNVWLAVGAAALLSGLIALFIGYVVLRVGGLYFALITLCMVEVVRNALVLASPLTNGHSGLIGIPAPAIGGLSFGIDKVPYYYLFLGVALLAVIVMYRIEHSRPGIALHSIGQNELLAQHVGVNLTRYRVLAFTMASGFAGLVGSLYAHYMHYVSPADFTFMQSLYLQIYVVIGGVGSILGAVVGTAFMIGVSQMLSFALNVQPIFYGLALLLTVILLPGGIVSLPRVLRLHSSIRNRPKKEEPVLQEVTTDL